MSPSSLNSGKFRIIIIFSSRRGHTRWPRDWSSDVCSSDLGPDLLALVPPGDCATGFRTRLISELQAHASRQIATRRLAGLLIARLFVAIPLLLVSACITAGGGILPFPTN